VSFSLKHAHVVVVDQGDGSDHVRLGRLPGFLDQFIADQVAEGFGAVGVAALVNQLIEFFQKLGIDGYANPAEAAHAYQIIESRGPGQMALRARGRFGGTNIEIVLLWKAFQMHIPDGFLATPVWAALDVAAAPAVGYLARRAQRGLEPAKVPLLGVMGAFVFAAQMINFPVGLGTSGHLVGAALLAYTLGPAAAGVVLTAILTVQALVFQDGGRAGAGRECHQHGDRGHAGGYLPFHLWGTGRWRRQAIFFGGFFGAGERGARAR
jgi:ABC-type Co2+ transport system permease subunit